MQTLFEKIGYEKIVEVITEFYERAFDDVFIGHFFINTEKKHIIETQIKFVSAMLGSNEIHYDGLPIKKVHMPLHIRPPHFHRRQIMMREVLDHCHVAEDLKNAWLQKEEQLKGLVLRGLNCDQ